MARARSSKVQKHIRLLAEQVGENPNALVPSGDNPICAKCGLCQFGARSPYLDAYGALNPVVTIVVDGVSKGEDEAGTVGAHGQAGLMLKLVKDFSDKTGLREDQVRVIPLTRCFPRTKKGIDLKPRVNHCKLFAVEDLRLHKPKLIVAVGTTALGALSHKSNAENWSGKLLTYRGWPDDWITDPKFREGHPVFGDRPTHEDRIPLIGLRSPRIVYGTQNPRVIKRWRDQILTALSAAVKGELSVPDYTRAYWHLSTDANEIIQTLQSIPDGVKLSFDVETNSLFPYRKGSAIVFMMFRWVDKGKPKSIGFPWAYPESPLAANVECITPHVLDALYRSKIQGHNLTFDILFVHGTLKGADINKLSSAITADTLLMRYTLRQERTSLGLDLLAYEHAPSLAGYEEDMVLLIQEFPELLDPAAGAGGHYARCPDDMWDSHLKPYVMGDVEVVHEAQPSLARALTETKHYALPLAHPDKEGKFRLYKPQRRDWVYENIMVRGQKVMTALMGRGMFIDLDELKSQEDLAPKAVIGARNKFKDSDPRVKTWVERKSLSDKDWTFDLESKDILKEVLYDVMGLSPVRLTKTGRRVYGDDLSKVPEEGLREYASTDKFALSTMAVNSPQIQHLLEYRKTHKNYTAYVRSMRNISTEGVDKKEREKEQYLMDDGCVHPTFNLATSRSGRLTSSNPNAQQIPKGSTVKRFYTSRFGKRGCIYGADMSQIELRIMAAVCGDTAMIQAYKDGVDLHSLTTSRIFNIDIEHFSKDYKLFLEKHKKFDEAKQLDLNRQKGKGCNFLTGYGGGPMGLQTMLAMSGIYLSIEECRDIIERFFDAYPSLRRHISYYKDFVQNNGVAVSLFGRVRVFEEVFGDDREAKAKALRSGYNHLIQSTASDLMLICLYVIEQLMRSENLESMLISTVHDSLVVDAVRDELDTVHEICSSVMDNIPDVLDGLFGQDYDASWITLPLKGDYEVGINYHEQKGVVGTRPDWDKLLAG